MTAHNIIACVKFPRIRLKPSNVLSLSYLMSKSVPEFLSVPTRFTLAVRTTRLGRLQVGFQEGSRWLVSCSVEQCEWVVCTVLPAVCSLTARVDHPWSFTEPNDDRDKTEVSHGIPLTRCV
ncbi:hypothetical protein RRG08_046866 [Elysia crispata]|uniref:Uncharacterized protein n=1 Tax=Elysia crispata TaxID=231223 RepID=A0AAE0ZIX4_9GAST|nr:hypothetical protein RRG08_046866 [Elysia crispata]